MSLAGAAALLAACGGSSSNSSGTAGGSLNVFSDTKAETPVKTGGIYKKWYATDLPSLDPYKQTSAFPNTEVGSYAMSRVVNFKSGPGVDPTDYDIQGDLADSWEITDGGLTYTFKMKQGVKFHNIAPVNGRVMDAEDVAVSYKRFSTGLTGGVGGSAATNTSLGSPSFGNSFQGVVESVTAPDKQTVVFKLTKPNAAFLNILATVNFFWIYPKEVDVSYDPERVVIGTGPFIWSNYVPSSRFEYTKNPDFYEKGVPYVDGAITYILPEPAQRIAQFQAGQVFQYNVTSFDEFNDLTKGNSAYRITGSGILPSVLGIGFGRSNPNSPFIKDVRARQAVSLSIDREDMMVQLNDIEKYKALGLTRDYRFGNFVPPQLSKWWVDPRGKEMGDAAQWFQFDPTKAKQLLSAAGYGSGFDFPQKYGSTDSGNNLLAGPLLQQYWTAVGMRANLMVEDYNSLFNPHSWHGETDGIVTHGWQTFGDPAQQLDYLFGPTSTRNQMAVNDPKFNALQDQNLAELDYTKRKAIILQELQYLGGEMRHVPSGADSINTFILHSPQVRNNWAYRSSDSLTAPVGTSVMHWWLAS